VKRALRVAAAVLLSTAAAASPARRLILVVDANPGGPELALRLDALLAMGDAAPLFPPGPREGLADALSARGFPAAAILDVSTGSLGASLRGFDGLVVSTAAPDGLASLVLAGGRPSFTLAVAAEPGRLARVLGDRLRLFGEADAALALVTAGKDRRLRVFWEAPSDAAAPGCALDSGAALIAASGGVAPAASRCGARVMALPDGEGYRVAADGDELTWRRGSGRLEGAVAARDPGRAAELSRRLLEGLERRGPARRARRAGDERVRADLRRLGYWLP